MKKALTISLMVTSIFAQQGVLENGFNTKVDFQNNKYLVSGGIKKGSNLFFSFEKFNINEKESLSFNDNNIKNNITRVTNEISLINGTLNSNAENLYLLNSNGIIFGKNAKLNLAGSLHTTTADYLKFEDNSILYTNPLKSSILTSSSPTSFGFLGENFNSIKIVGQGEIKINSMEKFIEESSKGVVLKDGKNLTLIASEILLEDGTFTYEEKGSEVKFIPISNLKVNSGSINLIATKSSGEINLKTLNNNFQELGDIKVINSNINANQSPNSKTPLNDEINFNAIADNFLMDKSTITSIIKNSKSNNLNINANNIFFLNRSSIVNTIIGENKSSNINLTAKNDIIFQNASFMTSSTFQSGNSGDITLNAQNINFTEGSIIESTSYGSGNSGNIILNSNENILFEGEHQKGGVSFIKNDVARGATGNNGNMFLNANNIFFKDGARVLSSIYGSGNGGSVELNAKESITFDGFEKKAKEEFDNSLKNAKELNRDYQYSSISTFNSDKSNGGNINLKANDIYFLNGAFINAINLSKGNPNNIEINAKSLNLDKFGVITSASIFNGKGGDIKIETQNLKLNNNSGITSRSQSKENGGDAGEINIQTNQNFILKNNSIISTTAEDAGGGDIKINSGKLFYLSNSKITTSVHGGDGNGGNVDIAKPTFSVLNSSFIYANAYGGNGGNINISARDFIKSTDSDIKASSKLGLDGEINIKAIEVDVSSTLTNLPTNFLDISKWKKTPCTKQNGSSSFIIKGKEGLPLMIDDYQPTPIEVE